MTTSQHAHQQMSYQELQEAILRVKNTFSTQLAAALNLQPVHAPRFLRTDTGLQDDLAGEQQAVEFTPTHTGDELEIVHSLAKWKRHTLGTHGYEPGEGIITDMHAIRKDETLDATHSLYVDQWDWERVITQDQRSLQTLKQTVTRIYDALRHAEKSTGLARRLPEGVTFIHTTTLAEKYPGMTPEERELAAAREHKAVFLIGIGHPLPGGEPHGSRAADYDDWSSTHRHGHGINGDLIVYDEHRDDALELSSMGVRVDADALTRQLRMLDVEHYARQPFHQAVLREELPHTIGGGIGQSRVAMYLLHRRHIGEVQASEWPDEIRAQCEKQGIRLL